jgi:hypothetical protein
MTPTEMAERIIALYARQARAQDELDRLFADLEEAEPEFAAEVLARIQAIELAAQDVAKGVAA